MFPAWQTCPYSLAASLIQVERIALERGERRVLEHVLVRCLQDHARRLARLPGLDPAQHMQAPAVAVLESPKAHLRPRGHEVVAARDTELEEVVRHLDADQMRDAVLVVRRA